MGALEPIVFDLSLARGLDYYTGVIYEAVLQVRGSCGGVGLLQKFEVTIGFRKVHGLLAVVPTCTPQDAKSSCFLSSTLPTGCQCWLRSAVISSLSLPHATPLPPTHLPVGCQRWLHCCRRSLHSAV